MITVEDLHKVYHQGKREVRALEGVSMTVPAGAIHGIIGHSGAGKSTLVRCLTMLDRPTSGTITINDVKLTGARSSALRTARRRIGLVFQHANLFDSRTIADNVAYPLELIGVGRRKRRDKVHELLQMVGLGDSGGAYPAQLSGGMRQRVGIARALATDPDVLLLDEPTSALDPKTTDEILHLIRTLRGRADLAVLVITHEMHVVKSICDSVSLLDGGRIMESGRLTEVVRKLEGRLSQALLGIPPHAAPGNIGGTLIDVLSTGDNATKPVVAHTSNVVGGELNIVAGSIEHLSGTTFSHLRIAVPDGIDPQQAIDSLISQGADARLTSTLDVTPEPLS